MTAGTCPLCGEFEGARPSVEAHISGKTDPPHAGKLGRDYRDEIEQGIEKIEDGADGVATEIEDDDLADLGGVADEIEDDGGDDQEDEPDDDQEDAALVEDDQEDDSTSRAEAVKADAKPDVGAAGTAAGASLLGGGLLLGDYDTKWLLYGGTALVLLLLAYLWWQNQQDNQNEQQKQNQQQKQPEQPRSVSGGLVS